MSSSLIHLLPHFLPSPCTLIVLSLPSHLAPTEEAMRQRSDTVPIQNDEYWTMSSAFRTLQRASNVSTDNEYVHIGANNLLQPSSPATTTDDATHSAPVDNEYVNMDDENVLQQTAPDFATDGAWDAPDDNEYVDMDEENVLQQTTPDSNTNGARSRVEGEWTFMCVCVQVCV